MQSSQVRNVGLPSSAEAKRDVPAWTQDPKIFPLDWFSVSRPNIIKQTKEYVSELSKWRNCPKIKTLSKLKAVLKRIMMFLHTHTSYIDGKSLLECDVEEDLITLVSLYMDMELRVLLIKKSAASGTTPSTATGPGTGSDMDTARNDKLVADRISYWLYTVLTGHEQRMDALLSTTVFTRHTRPVLDPIFRKILSEMSDGPFSNVNYVRHMLAYKTWRERALVADDAPSEQLNSRVQQHLVPRDYAFPEPLLRCLGKGSARDHARPHNVNLADACRKFMRFCREMPAVGAEQINFGSIPLLDDDMLGDEENEVNKLMNMISDRKQRKAGSPSLSPKRSFHQVHAFIDLTLPKSRMKSISSRGIPSIAAPDVIDLTEEDEKPIRTSRTSAALEPPVAAPPRPSLAVQLINASKKAQPPQDCSYASAQSTPQVDTRCFTAYREQDIFLVNISCRCPVRAHRQRAYQCQDKKVGYHKENKALKTSITERNYEKKDATFVGRCCQFSIGNQYPYPSEDDVDTEIQPLVIGNSQDQVKLEMRSSAAVTCNTNEDEDEDEDESRDETTEFFDKLFSASLNHCDCDGCKPRDSNLSRYENRTCTSAESRGESANELSDSVQCIEKPLVTCTQRVSHPTSVADMYAMEKTSPIVLQSQPSTSSSEDENRLEHFTETLDKRKINLSDNTQNNIIPADKLIQSEENLSNNSRNDIRKIKLPVIETVTDVRPDKTDLFVRSEDILTISTNIITPTKTNEENTKIAVSSYRSEDKFAERTSITAYITTPNESDASGKTSLINIEDLTESTNITAPTTIHDRSTTQVPKSPEKTSVNAQYETTLHMSEIETFEDFTENTSLTPASTILDKSILQELNTPEKMSLSNTQNDTFLHLSDTRAEIEELCSEISKLGCSVLSDVDSVIGKDGNTLSDENLLQNEISKNTFDFVREPMSNVLHSETVHDISAIDIVEENSKAFPESLEQIHTDATEVNNEYSNLQSNLCKAKDENVNTNFEEALDNTEEEITNKIELSHTEYTSSTNVAQVDLVAKLAPEMEFEVEVGSISDITVNLPVLNTVNDNQLQHENTSPGDTETPFIESETEKLQTVPIETDIHIEQKDLHTVQVETDVNIEQQELHTAPIETDIHIEQEELHTGSIETNVNIEKPELHTVMETEQEKEHVVQLETDVNIEQQELHIVPVETEVHTERTELYKVQVETDVNIEQQELHTTPIETNIHIEPEELHTIQVETDIIEEQEFRTVPTETHVLEEQELHAVEVETDVNIEQQELHTVPVETDIHVEHEEIHTIQVETDVIEEQELRTVPIETHVLEQQELRTIPIETHVIEQQELHTVQVETDVNIEQQELHTVPIVTNVLEQQELHTASLETDVHIEQELHTVQVETDVIEQQELRTDQVGTDVLVEQELCTGQIEKKDYMDSSDTESKINNIGKQKLFLVSDTQQKEMSIDSTNNTVNVRNLSPRKRRKRKTEVVTDESATENELEVPLHEKSCQIINNVDNDVLSTSRRRKSRSLDETAINTEIFPESELAKTTTEYGTAPEITISSTCEENSPNTDQLTMPDLTAEISTVDRKLNDEKPKRRRKQNLKNVRVDKTILTTTKDDKSSTQIKDKKLVVMCKNLTESEIKLFRKNKEESLPVNSVKLITTEENENKIKMKPRKKNQVICDSASNNIIEDATPQPTKLSEAEDEQISTNLNSKQKNSSIDSETTISKTSEKLTFQFDNTNKEKKSHSKVKVKARRKTLFAENKITNKATEDQVVNSPINKTREIISDRKLRRARGRPPKIEENKFKFFSENFNLHNLDSKNSNFFSPDNNFTENIEVKTVQDTNVPLNGEVAEEDMPLAYRISQSVSQKRNSVKSSKLGTLLDLENKFYKSEDDLPLSTRKEKFKSSLSPKNSKHSVLMKFDKKEKINKSKNMENLNKIQRDHITKCKLFRSKLEQFKFQPRNKDALLEIQPKKIIKTYSNRKTLKTPKLFSMPDLIQTTKPKKSIRFSDEVTVINIEPRNYHQTDFGTYTNIPVITKSVLEDHQLKTTKANSNVDKISSPCVEKIKIKKSRKTQGKTVSLSNAINTNVHNKCIKTPELADTNISNTIQLIEDKNKSTNKTDDLVIEVIITESENISTVENKIANISTEITINSEITHTIPSCTDNPELVEEITDNVSSKEKFNEKTKVEDEDLKKSLRTVDSESNKLFTETKAVNIGTCTELLTFNSHVSLMPKKMLSKKAKEKMLLAQKKKDLSKDKLEEKFEKNTETSETKNILSHTQFQENLSPDNDLQQFSAPLSVNKTSDITTTLLSELTVIEQETSTKKQEEIIFGSSETNLKTNEKASSSTEINSPSFVKVEDTVSENVVDRNSQSVELSLTENLEKEDNKCTSKEKSEDTFHSTNQTPKIRKSKFPKLKFKMNSKNTQFFSRKPPSNVKRQPKLKSRFGKKKKCKLQLNGINNKTLLSKVRNFKQSRGKKSSKRLKIINKNKQDVKSTEQCSISNLHLEEDRKNVSPMVDEHSLKFTEVSKSTVTVLEPFEQININNNSKENLYPDSAITVDLTDDIPLKTDENKQNISQCITEKNESTKIDDMLYKPSNKIYEKNFDFYSDQDDASNSELVIDTSAESSDADESAADKDKNDHQIESQITVSKQAKYHHSIAEIVNLNEENIPIENECSVSETIIENSSSNNDINNTVQDHEVNAGDPSDTQTLVQVSNKSNVLEEIVNETNVFRDDIVERQIENLPMPTSNQVINESTSEKTKEEDNTTEHQKCDIFDSVLDSSSIPVVEETVVNEMTVEETNVTKTTEDSKYHSELIDDLIDDTVSEEQATVLCPAEDTKVDAILDEHITVQNPADKSEEMQEKVENKKIVLEERTAEITEISEEIYKEFCTESLIEEKVQLVQPFAPSVEMFLNIEVGYESCTISQKKPIEVEHAKEGCVKCSVNGKHKDNKKITVRGIHQYQQNIIEESLEEDANIPAIPCCQAVESFEPDSCNLTAKVVSVKISTNDNPVLDNYNLCILADIAMNSVHLNTKTENNVMEVIKERSNEIQNQNPIQKDERCFFVTFPENMPDSSKPTTSLSIINSNNEEISVNVQKLAGGLNAKGTLLENRIQALTERAKNGTRINGESLDELYKSLENICEPEIHTLTKTSPKSDSQNNILPASVPVDISVMNPKIPEPNIPIDIPNIALLHLTPDDDDFMIKNEPFSLQTPTLPSLPIETAPKSTVIENKAEFDTTGVVKNLYNVIESLTNNQKVSSENENSDCNITKEEEQGPKIKSKKGRVKSKSSNNQSSETSYLLNKYKSNLDSNKNTEVSNQNASNNKNTPSPPSYIRSTRPMRMVTTRKRNVNVLDNSCPTDEPVKKVSVSEKMFDKLLEEHRKELSETKLKDETKEKTSDVSTESSCMVQDTTMPILDDNVSQTNILSQPTIQAEELNIPLPVLQYQMSEPDFRNEKITLETESTKRDLPLFCVEESQKKDNSTEKISVETVQSSTLASEEHQIKENLPETTLITTEIDKPNETSEENALKEKESVRETVMFDNIEVSNHTEPQIDKDSSSLTTEEHPIKENLPKNTLISTEIDKPIETSEENALSEKETVRETIMSDNMEVNTCTKVQIDKNEQIVEEEVSNATDRNASAIEVVQDWFKRVDKNKAQAEPYAEITSYQTIEECNFFEESSSTSENSPNVRKNDEKVFNEHQTPDSGIAFDEDSVQKDKSIDSQTLVPENLSDGETYSTLEPEPITTKAYFCNLTGGETVNEQQDEITEKPKISSEVEHMKLKVSIALDRIKDILPMLTKYKIDLDKGTKRKHSLEEEQMVLNPIAVQDFNKTLLKIKRRKHSIDDIIVQECVVEEVTSSAPAQKDVPSTILTKGAVKEYPDCLFGITESPVPSGSFNSPYPSDISLTEEPAFYEEEAIDLCNDYPCYDSFEVLQEQQSLQKDYSVVDDNPKDVQQGLQAGYCVVDSQFLPLSEYMNDGDYILIDNKIFNDKRMVPVNMHQVQPEFKSHTEEVKRSEFDDSEKEDSLSETVDEIIKNPNLFPEQSTSEIQVISMDQATSEVQVVIACDTYQETEMADTYLFGNTLQNELTSNDTTSPSMVSETQHATIDLEGATPESKVNDKPVDFKPATPVMGSENAQFCNTSVVPVADLPQPVPMELLTAVDSISETVITQDVENNEELPEHKDKKLTDTYNMELKLKTKNLNTDKGKKQEKNSKLFPGRLSCTESHNSNVSTILSSPTQTSPRIFPKPCFSKSSKSLSNEQLISNGDEDFENKTTKDLDSKGHNLEISNKNYSASSSSYKDLKKYDYNHGTKIPNQKSPYHDQKLHINIQKSSVNKYDPTTPSKYLSPPPNQKPTDTKIYPKPYYPKTYNSNVPMDAFDKLKQEKPDSTPPPNSRSRYQSSSSSNLNFMKNHYRKDTPPADRRFSERDSPRTRHISQIPSELRRPQSAYTESSPKLSFRLPPSDPTHRSAQYNCRIPDAKTSQSRNIKEPNTHSQSSTSSQAHKDWLKNETLLNLIKNANHLYSRKK